MEMGADEKFRGFFPMEMGADEKVRGFFLAGRGFYGAVWRDFHSIGKLCGIPLNSPSLILM